MKKLLSLIMASLFSVAAFSAEKGGEPETIYFNVKMQEEVGVKDVAEGLSDVFLKSIKASTYNGLDQATKDKLEVYSVPSGSWSFFVNPVPNKAPYHIEKNGVTEFNPFAIKDVRFALNFLIDRKKVVDEILNGAGGVKFTQATSGQPNAWRIELVANKYGFTPEGDQGKAIADINAAMEKAAKHPENKGRLVKKGQFWHFDGNPVTIRFVIRVDDPNGRLKLGNYTADLIEQAGIKVDRLLWDFKKAGATVYYSDPANADWHLYTEGWGAGSTYVWWIVPTRQYHVVEGGHLPGGNTEGWWNFKFEDPKATELGKQLSEEKFKNLDEQWDVLQKLTGYGLEDSNRIFLVYQNDYFVANKDRFEERMFYGLGNGLKRFALENAKVKDDVLTVTQYSGAGGTFSSPWDPVGQNGFSDVYTSNIVSLIFDREIIDGPMGDLFERRSKVVSTRSEPVFNADGSLSGNISVDSKAVKYDPYTQEYVSVGKGTKAAIETTYKIDMGVWHHGRPITMNDYLYARAFIGEWAVKTGDNDKRYDQAYAGFWESELLAITGGFRIDSEDTITIWTNSNHAGGGLFNIGTRPLLRVKGANQPGYAVPWEILEALDAIVVNGSPSRKTYGFTEKEGVNPVDLKNPMFNADVLAQLKKFVAEKHIPKVLKGRLSEKEVLLAYNQAIKFIEEKGHALIGYGSYYLNQLDAKTGFAELKAFRHELYTEEKGKWSKLLKTDYLRIESVETPDLVVAGDDAVFELNVSQIQYPADTASKATKGTVKALLILEDGLTKEFDGEFTGNGTFEIVIPGDDTVELAGNYTVILTATLDGQFTGTKTVKIEVF